MKKNLIIGMLVTMVLLASSVAMAGKTHMFTIAPSAFGANIVDDDVVLTWSDSGFYKYSVDVDIPQDVYTASYSFSTDKNDPSVCFYNDTTLLYDCSLIVPLSAFVWDTEADPLTDPVPIYGTAYVKVKALDPPGKKKFNQHNAFSETDTFVLVAPAP